MRIREILTERAAFTYFNMQDMRVPVYKNPTVQTIRRILDKARYVPAVRGLFVATDGAFYVWDAGLATHFEIARHMGVIFSDTRLFVLKTDSITFLLNTMLYDMDPSEVEDFLADFRERFPQYHAFRITWKRWQN